MDNSYGIFILFVDVLQHKGGCVTGIAQRQEKLRTLASLFQYGLSQYPMQ